MKTVVWAVGRYLSEALENKCFFVTKYEAQAHCNHKNQYDALAGEFEVFRVEVYL